MKNSSFLHDDIFKELSYERAVICLQGETYSPLFCRQFMSYIARIYKRPVAVADIYAEDYASVMSALNTTFLGTRLLYWLKSDELLPKKMGALWHNYLASYQGPHSLVFFTNNLSAKSDKWYPIKIPKEVNKADFYGLTCMMEGRKEVADVIFKDHRSVSLDTAVLLIQYSKVLGKNFGLFLQKNAHDLFTPEQSLFELSQTFFSRKWEHFLRLWQQMESTYMPPFWVSFWSEQLWQAYVFVKLRGIGDEAGAKKNAYRLPFSFCNRDWRRYSAETMKCAYQELYKTDFHLKNGGTQRALELFYFNFMSGVFDKGQGATQRL